jgi:hypothetical protein
MFGPDVDVTAIRVKSHFGRDLLRLGIYPMLKFVAVFSTILIWFRILLVESTRNLK